MLKVCWYNSYYFCLIIILFCLFSSTRASYPTKATADPTDERKLHKLQHADKTFIWYDCCLWSSFLSLLFSIQSGWKKEIKVFIYSPSHHETLRLRCNCERKWNSPLGPIVLPGGIRAVFVYIVLNNCIPPLFFFQDIIILIVIIIIMILIQVRHPPLCLL